MHRLPLGQCHRCKVRFFLRILGLGRHRRCSESRRQPRKKKKGPTAPAGDWSAWLTATICINNRTITTSNRNLPSFDLFVDNSRRTKSEVEPIGYVDRNEDVIIQETVLLTLTSKWSIFFNFSWFAHFIPFARLNFLFLDSYLWRAHLNSPQQLTILFNQT